MHTTVTPKPQGRIAALEPAFSVGQPVLGELSTPAEVECPYWLEGPIARTDIDAVHWLELGHSSE